MNDVTRPHFPPHYTIRSRSAGLPAPIAVSALGEGDGDSAEPAAFDAELPCIAAPRCKVMVKVTQAFAAHRRSIGMPWALCAECVASVGGMVDRRKENRVAKVCAECGVHPVRKYARCMKCRAKTSGQLAVGSEQQEPQPVEA